MHLGHAPMVVAIDVDVPDFNAAYVGATTAIERLSTEPIGQVTLTLTNVVVGSRYRIERQGDGSLATPAGNAEGVAASSTVSLLLDYYAGGSPNNDLRIKVRKASGTPNYIPFETQATLSATPQSIFVGQILDE